ncbi:HNH endonuclease [Taklimakanibacter lacteus]|uniref:HNH endonuclease n=1 Tax=Taklimakanibacter lacteus TaxID=2268456 RepID=UPI000E66D39A
MHAHPALVLNADFRPLSYFPLSLIPWQDAVSAIVSDKISVVAEYDFVARSPSTAIRLPSVVALRKYQPVPPRVAFARFNVFLRDRFKCQYCAGKFPAAELTFDHVLPRCRGGRTSWDNVVAACSPCNQAKDKFSAMQPGIPPREPTPQELLAAKRAFPPNYLHESWNDYLY